MNVTQSQHGYQSALSTAAIYHFSEEWIQGEPQSHGTPLPAGDGLYAMWILPSG